MESDCEEGEGTKSSENPKPRRNSVLARSVCSIPGCGLRFRRKDALDRHEFHHTGIKKHFCLYEDCGKSYTTLTILKRHVRLSHEDDGQSKASVVLCKVEDCKQTFTNMYNMLRHIKEVHENPKIYFCKHCNMEFTQKLKMRRHEIKEHTGVYPFNCLKCKKGFYQKFTYAKHIRICQTYECPGCELIFTKWTVFRKHCRETKHGRTYHECGQCQRLFKKPGELKRHVALHHEKEENRPNFPCPEQGCTRSYSYERNLRQHIKVAHSKLRIVCNEVDCDKEFTSLQNLNKHKMRVHQKSKVPKTLLVSKKKQKKERRKRKDAGRSRVSEISKMSNMIIDKETDLLLRLREEKTLNEVSDLLEQLIGNELDENDEMEMT